MQNCIRIARERSAEARTARNNFDIATYDYQLYRRSILPTLSLSGNLPALNRTISKITMPDGSESFVAQSTGNYTATLSIQQPIPFTGGNFYVSSGLQRLDIYHDSTISSYLGNLISVGISQPLVTYNPYKWQRKLAPVQYRKAERDYIEALENASMQVVTFFFNLLETQTSLQIARQNREVTDTLLSMARQKYALGKITEDVVLELEVNRLNLLVQIEELGQTLAEQRQALADYLGIFSDDIGELQVPDMIDLPSISGEQACREAEYNGTLVLDHAQRKITAESDLARAKADNGFSVDLQAAFGLSKNDELFKNIYRNPLDQEQITLSFNLPLIDWGIARYKRKKAKLALDNINKTIDKEKLDFRRTLQSTVNQYNLQTSQIRLVNKTIDLSSTRYKMSLEKYVSGKIDYLEYSAALSEKNSARVLYIQTLQKHWVKYYEIRKLTLYDFLAERKIEMLPSL
ncbi:MAG: TolC family protein [Bacteroidales bacterium]|nr:TolC family protein [Bacteroidales bacterium]